MIGGMRLDRLRWILLPSTAAMALVMLWKGTTPGRLGLSTVLALSWYGLSRRKTHSLDQDRFQGGRLGRRP